MQTDEIRSELARLVAASSAWRALDRVTLVPEAVQGPRPEAPDSALNDPAQPAPGLTREIAELTRQVSGLREASTRQSESLDANTRAAASRSESRSVVERVSDVAKAVRSPLNFGVSPLISGIARLFGGGKTEAPPELPVFQLPEQVAVDAGFSASRGEFGEVTRGVEPAPRITRQTSQPLVSINVNAMDSRSFLDHSDEIARAVRQAMLDTHSLNDVVNDL